MGRVKNTCTYVIFKKNYSKVDAFKRVNGM